MKREELTLGKTLIMIAELDIEIDKLINEMDKTSDTHKFRGERISDMDINRLCYQLGIVGSMFEVFNGIVKDMDDEYAVRADIIEVAVYDERALEAIKIMKTLVMMKLALKDISSKRNALQEHAENFNEEDYKRIHKEKSLKILAGLGIVT